MANDLQYTIDMITPFCRYMAADIGVDNQPIVGIASTVRNIMLAAPMTWKFNRATYSFPITAGTQDYEVAVPSFGFLEKATLENAAGSMWAIQDIKNNEALGESTTQARPTAIAVQNDDGSGTYTFRLSAVPEAAYTVNLVYQMGPTQFTEPTDPWSPIPDAFSDIYNNLCLGYYMDSCQDPRAAQYISRGIAGLLARAQGLTSLDKALFAASYMNLDAQSIINTLKAQQGQQAQGSR